VVVVGDHLIGPVGRPVVDDDVLDVVVRLLADGPYRPRQDVRPVVRRREHTHRGHGVVGTRYDGALTKSCRELSRRRRTTAGKRATWTTTGRETIWTTTDRTTQTTTDRTTQTTTDRTTQTTTDRTTQTAADVETPPLCRAHGTVAPTGPVNDD
jgi:hypothetical protein